MATPNAVEFGCTSGLNPICWLPGGLGPISAPRKNGARTQFNINLHAYHVGPMLDPNSHSGSFIVAPMRHDFA